MKAEITSGIEYGTERPCQIGRLTYRVGVRRYVALAFRYPDDGGWRLTWIGEEGHDALALPMGIAPSAEMLAALATALGTVGLL